MAGPSTPTKKPDFIGIIGALNDKWKLELPVSTQPQSPSTISLTIENIIFDRLKFLCFRSTQRLESIISQFDGEAQALLAAPIIGSTNETYGNRSGQFGDHHRSRRSSSLAVTPERRSALLALLDRMVGQAFNEAKAELAHRMSPSSSVAAGSGEMQAQTPSRLASRPPVFRRSGTDSRVDGSGAQDPFCIPKPSSLPTRWHPANTNGTNIDAGPRRTLWPIVSSIDANRAVMLQSRLPEVSGSAHHVAAEEDDSLSAEESYTTPPESPSSRYAHGKQVERFGSQAEQITASRSLKRPFPDPIERYTAKKLSRASILEQAGTILVHEWRLGHELERSLERRPSSFRAPDAALLSDSFSTAVTNSSSQSSRSTAPNNSGINTAQTSFQSEPPSRVEASSRMPRKKGFARAETTVRPLFEKEVEDDAITVASMARSTSDPGLSKAALQELSNEDELEAHVFQRLSSSNPFAGHNTDASKNFSFRVRWEVLRLSLTHNVPEEALYSALARVDPRNLEDYEKLWCFLQAPLSGSTLRAPKSQPEAWKRCAGTFEDVKLSIKLVLNKGDDRPLFSLQLNPLMIGSSNRLERIIGCDRSITMQLPTIKPDNLPSRLKPRAAEALQYVAHWFIDNPPSFLGRDWLLLFPKPIERNKIHRKTSDKGGARYFTVQLVGLDVGSATANDVSATGLRKFIRNFMDVLNLIVPPSLNYNQPALKLFARLALGLLPPAWQLAGMLIFLVLSRTTPTISFEHWQIVRTDDAYAHLPQARVLEQLNLRLRPPKHAVVMNDGCALISYEAMRLIAIMLGLDFFPSVIQGRIGGAKGIWMIDPLGQVIEPPADLDVDTQVPARSPLVWIELTSSQVKFELLRDESPLTLEIVGFSRPPKVGSLNYQLMSVLLEGGVPQETFENIIYEGIVEEAEMQKAAMGDSRKLAAYLQRVYPSIASRGQLEHDTSTSGLPGELPERIRFLTQAGFEPSKNSFLMECCRAMLRHRNDALLNRGAIPIAKSVSVYMIADPLNVLEPDECHLYFSTPFMEKSEGFSRSVLHDLDVIISRSPALAPTDARKLRAIFKPELAGLKDVLVLSSRSLANLENPRSAADFLSGGDYDGDTALVCWDENIVGKFTNTCIIEKLGWDENYFGMTKDDTKTEQLLDEAEFEKKFLKKGFAHHLQPAILGRVTNYFEGWIYKLWNEGSNSPLSEESSLKLTALMGLLVDSLKAGLKFTEYDWMAYKRREGLPLAVPRPAYRDAISGKPTPHPIDQLVLKYIKELIEKQLTAFENEFGTKAEGGADLYDKELAEVLKNELNFAQNHETALVPVLASLQEEMEKLVSLWSIHFRRGFSEEENSFKILVEDLRRRFLEIEPLQKNGNLSALRMSRGGAGDERLSTHGSWLKLKASCLYGRTYKYQSKMAWWVCGYELGRIKAEKDGNSRTMVSRMHHILKVDKAAVKHIALAGSAYVADEEGIEEEHGDIPEEHPFGDAWEI